MTPRPSPEAVVAALECVVQACLGGSSELRERVAILADWVGSVARTRPDDDGTVKTAADHSGDGAGTSAGAFSEVRVCAPESPAPAPTHTVIVTRSPDERRPVSSAVVPLKIGDAEIHLRVEGSTAEIGHARRAAAMETEPKGVGAGAGEADLGMIARRCSLKAASCEAALKRNEAAAGSEEESVLVGRITTMIAQAKALPHCFLWAPFRQAVLPPAGVVEMAGRAYENLGAAAALAERVHGRPELRGHLPDALDLMAEAQSALRVILERTWLTRPDQDQLDAFVWLRRVTEAERVYVGRYLTLEDPADPAGHEGLRGRIRDVEAQIDGAARRVKDVTAALNKLKYHVRRAVESPEEGEMAGVRAAGAVLEAQGLDAGDRRVREIVRPLVDLAEGGADLGPLVGEAISLMRERAGEDHGAMAEPRAYSPTVGRVRDALRGSRVVMIGGTALAHQRERLAEAFELGELDWVEQTEHGSSALFEAPIARADTRLVIALVKLAGHEHIDAVRKWSRQYGKPLVLLKAGFNPEQAAAAIMEQASEQLLAE